MRSESCAEKNTRIINYNCTDAALPHFVEIVCIMKINVKNLPKSQIEFEVILPYADIVPDLEKAAKELSKKHAIKGFRPGKASLDVVQKSLGKAKVLEHAINIIVPRTLIDVLHDQKEEEIEVIGRPEIAIKQIVPEQDVIYTAKFSRLPVVRVHDLDSIKTKRKEVKVGEEKHKRVIRDLQKMRAKETSVKRPIKKGDKVLLDMKLSLAGVPVEGGNQRGIMIWVGEDQMVPGYNERIIGASVGQKLNFELKFPEKYHVAHLAGKNIEFEVIIKNVFEVELPDLNDEFARGLGAFKTFGEFEAKLKDNLKEEAEHEEDVRVERELLRELVKKSEIGELPEILVEHEMSMALQEIKSGVEQRGIRYKEWLESLKKTEGEIEKDLRPQAEERARASLITRQIAKDEGIEVTEEEIEAEVNAQLMKYKGNEQAEKNIQSNEFRDLARREIENRKVMDYLKNKCVLRE